MYAANGPELPAMDWNLPNGSCNSESPKTKTESEIENGTAQMGTMLPISSHHEDHDIPKGLSDDEAEAYTTFSRLCREKGLLDRPDGFAEEDLLEGLIDSTSLLRFLRARRFDPESALQQFTSARKVHDEQCVLQVYEKVGLAHYEVARLLWPHWTGRRDRQGRPIYFVDLVKFDWTVMPNWSKLWNAEICADPLSTDARLARPNMQQLIAAVLDHSTRFVFPLYSAVADRPHPEQPITKATYVVDASCMTLGLGWLCRNMARDASGLLTTSYPETISRIFVCNTPSYFATIWNFLKKWVDPVTAAKVVVLSPTETPAALTEKIDPVNIPIQLGGKFAYEQGMVPNLDHSIQQSLTWLGEPNLPPGPIKWVKDGNGDSKVIAVGSIDGKARREEVARLVARKKENPDRGRRSHIQPLSLNGVS